MDRALPGPVRRADGTVAGADLRPPARVGDDPSRHRTLAAPSVGPGLGDAGRPGAGAGQPVHGVFRRLPVLHRRPDRSPARLHRRDRATDRQHRRHAGVGQRGQCRGWHGGVDQRHPPVQLRPGRVGGDVPAHRTRSEGRSPTTTTRGAGPWRATRRSSAGSARSTKAAWPIPASCRLAGRLRVAPGASATSSRTPSTCCPPCSSWWASTAPDEIE